MTLLFRVSRHLGIYKEIPNGFPDLSLRVTLNVFGVTGYGSFLTI